MEMVIGIIINIINTLLVNLQGNVIETMAGKLENSYEFKVS